MQNYKGQLNKIFNDKEVQDYINNSSVNGYLGHEFRNNETDRILESIANKHDYLLDSISYWVRSKQARHFMDDFENDIEFFKQNILSTIQNLNIN